ncbi:hypothetical protein LTR16_003565, partial [Cryomyces antarcticus]
MAEATVLKGYQMRSGTAYGRDRSMSDAIGAHTNTPPAYGRDRSFSDAVGPYTNNTPSSPLNEASLPPLGPNFPRAASYTYLPNLQDQRYGGDPFIEVKGSFSEVDLLGPIESTADESSSNSSGGTSPENEPVKTSEALHEGGEELYKSPTITISRFTLSESQRRNDIQYNALERNTRSEHSPVSVARPRPPPRAVTTKLNRKSWASTPSRSPSPIRRHDEGEIRSGADPKPSPVSGGRKSFTFRRRDTVQEVSEKPGPGTLHRKGTALSRRAKKPLTTLLGGFPGADDGPPAVPRVPSLPKSFSTDRLPSFGLRSHTSSERPPPVPRKVSSDSRVHSHKGESARKKDELWSTFRALDGDFT